MSRIHSGWLERVSTWKVTVIHSLESVGCLVLFGSSQLSKSNCQRSTWLPCASHMGYSVHTPNFWTSGDLVGTSALHVQLVRRTSQHWIVIWTLGCPRQVSNSFVKFRLWGHSMRSIKCRYNAVNILENPNKSLGYGVSFVGSYSQRHEFNTNWYDAARCMEAYWCHGVQNIGIS